MANNSPDIEAIFRRMDRKDGQQDKFGACLICGKNFVGCRHVMGEVNTLLAAWRLVRSWKRENNR